MTTLLGHSPGSLGAEAGEGREHLGYQQVSEPAASPALGMSPGPVLLWWNNQEGVWILQKRGRGTVEKLSKHTSVGMGMS